MITIQNIVLLALVQVGLLVTGVLTGGLARRVGRYLGGDDFSHEAELHGLGGGADLRMPLWNIALVDWWALWLLVPVLWVTLAVAILNKPRVPDCLKRWSFGSGFVMLAGWLILIWLGGLLPLLRGLGLFTTYID